MTVQHAGVTDAYWSASTAMTWEKGLATGDGRLGALLFGDADEHQLVLAHERVVLPTDPPRDAPTLASDLSTFRSLIELGRAQDAAELAVTRSREQGYPGLQWTDPLVPVATISIRDDGEGEVDAYRRVVRPEEGLVEVAWARSGRARRIRAFVSRSSGFLVIEAIGFQPGDPSPTLRPPANAVTSSSGVRGGNESRVVFSADSLAGAEELRLTFRAPWSFRPTGARTIMTSRSNGGGARLLLASVDPEDDRAPAREDRLRTLESEPPGFDELRASHLHASSRLPAGPTFRLAGGATGASTDALLTSADPAAAQELVALQYRAAQATIRASTGELPPTLQGVWSGTFDPAWSSDYTMNGNVQNGSIAAMLGSGRSDLLRTHLRMLEGFEDDFRQNAKRLFGAPGYVLPSRCSPTHGRTTHFDARHCHEFWTAGGAWAAASFFDDVWHTGDLDFLADHAYPFGREVERFYESFLEDDGEHLVFSPSYSPENTSPTFGSQACRNATMDRAAVWRLTTDLRRAARLLGIDADLDAGRTARISRLPPYRVAPDGTLAEWLDDGVEERLGHRTTSQLFGLWFEPEPQLLQPTLEGAAVTLIAKKLAWRASAPGREEMAYGLVQLGVAAAALGDAEAAFDCIERMSRQYFLPSLMTTHDVGAIFNVDISGGFPAVIHAMLAGSSLHELSLLPAVPPRWESGGVQGIRVRGGLEIADLTWDPNGARATLVADAGSSRLRGGRDHVVIAPAGMVFEGGGARMSIALGDGESRTFTLRAAPVER